MNTVKNDLPGSGRENFVSRLYQMLSTPEFAGIVSWNETDQGPSFVIFDTAKFQDQVLVSEFNHANFSSFVRQLNKYDFHKVKFRDSHSRIWEFRHPFFRPENSDKPYLIKRKQQSNTRRMRRNDSVMREQADVAAKAAELAASNAEEIMNTQVNDLESRVQRLEENNVQFLSALKMQHRLVERLLKAVDLPEEDPQELNQVMNMGPMASTSNQNMPVYDVPSMQRPMMSNGRVTPSNMRQMPSGVGNEMQIDSNYPPVIPPNSVSMHQSGMRGLSILMGVDDEKIKTVVTSLLNKIDCSVEAVENGVDVVQRVETQNYDYILVDSILKGLDGVSAVELIRQSNSYTPIILMTDANTGDEHEAYLSRGVSTVLYRPFSQSDLYKALQEFKPLQRMM